MKKNIIVIMAMAAVLGFSGVTYAAETDSFKDSAGITPDNVILYPLDKAIDSAKVYFASSEENKAEVISEVAEERLGESEVMTAKGKAELAETALKEYNDNMSQAVGKIKDIVESETETDGTIADRIKAIEEKIAERQTKSIDVLNKMGDNASENAKTILHQVIQMQTTKKEAMINILKEKQVLIDAKKALSNTKAVLEKAKTSGDETAISQAETALTGSQKALDAEMANYKEVFNQEKANMKTSVGELKKEINSSRDEAVNKEDNGINNSKKNEVKDSKGNNKNGAKDSKENSKNVIE